MPVGIGWTSYSVPIEQSFWSVTGDWDALLTNVTNLYIDIDYNDFEGNAYYQPSTSDSRFIDNSDDNNIGTVNFANWQSQGGHDTPDGKVFAFAGPLTDPNPSNGGCML